MRARTSLLGLLGGLVVLVALAIGLAAAPDGGELAVERSVVDALGGGTEGFARADRPRSFRFPADHGPHPDFRTEWWYFTGNLEGADGTPLGYQLTFFRQALAPDAPDRPSRWATRQAWMAHFAVVDGARGVHRAFERFARGALDLAGARGEPFRVWVDGWQAAARDGFSPLRLEAAADGVKVDLELVAERPPFLQGDGGLSAKGRAPENASYYYSVPRFATRGEVAIEGRRYRVAGLSWLDREWSTSLLEPGQQGWDWLALQLSDGTDLMLFRLRGTEEAAFRDGTLMFPDGSSRRLAGEDFVMEPRGWWRSPAGTRYPVAWEIAVPDAGLSLLVTPLVEGQELAVSFRYWEGAVRAEGRAGDRTVTGRGYLELVGYGSPARRPSD